MAARRYDPLIIVHNFPLFVDIFLSPIHLIRIGFFIFVPIVAWKPRYHTTDYRINIYVLSFIQYETAFTINQTLPRDAEDCRLVPCHGYGHGRGVGADRRSVFDMSIWLGI